MQAKWDERGWLDAPDPIDQLRDSVPLEHHDLVELELLYPGVTGWLGCFSLLALHLAEHFKLDPTAVRDFVSHEGRAELVELVRRELRDGDGEPATASDEIDREATA